MAVQAADAVDRSSLDNDLYSFEAYERNRERSHYRVEMTYGLIVLFFAFLFATTTQGDWMTLLMIVTYGCVSTLLICRAQEDKRTWLAKYK